MLKHLEAAFKKRLLSKAIDVIQSRAEWTILTTSFILGPDSVIYLVVNGTVTSPPVFIQNILNCVLKTNKAFTGLERHWGTTANLSVTVKTLCCGRDEFKVYCILNYKYSVYMVFVYFTVVLYSSLFLISWHFNNVCCYAIIIFLLFFIYLQKKIFY